ncbi:hypothetical protein J3U18_07135 [Gilliamella sp. B3482]|nr:MULTISPECIES: hypothetical protein [unclassified Gilliamella]MCX8581462.1 hypothetical protein [Gilliamella sp. B3482]MCX8682365.1 hypothetical protein [Gilliamella sp. B2889]
MVDNINYKSNYQQLYTKLNIVFDIVGIREKNKKFTPLNDKTAEIFTNDENINVFNFYNKLLSQKKKITTLDYYSIDNMCKFYLINKISLDDNNVFFWGNEFKTIPLNFIIIKNNNVDLSIELLDKLSTKEKNILWFLIFKFESKLIARLANTTVTHVFNTKQKVKNLFNLPIDTLIYNDSFKNWIFNFHVNCNIENTSILLDEIDI